MISLASMLSLVLAVTPCGYSSVRPLPETEFQPELLSSDVLEHIFFFSA